MATTTNYTQLDFDAAKANIVSYLQSQTEFQDVNFTGSAMQMLVNALAYTYNQLAQYANMSITELFLDSAQLRSSVVSRAKELGYTPRSAESAYAQLTLTLVLDPSETGYNDIYIPAGVRFAAAFNNKSFSFVTLNRYQMLEQKDINNTTINPGTYLATIQVYEGLLTSQVQTSQSNATTNPLYTISNQNIDTRFVGVSTQEVAGSSNLTTWSLSNNVARVNNQSNVFWIQEGVDGFWQIYFGDDIIGVQPPASAVINIQYLVTQGSAANGINVFAMTDSITRAPTNAAPIVFAPTSFNIDIIAPAGFGSDLETTTSIALNAPQTYKTQNRAVTRDDYVALLSQQYGFIETMSVWGGQDNVPPQYGSVFISIKPTYGNFLSPATKLDITNTLQSTYAIIGINPQIVDPDFTYINVNTNIFYNQSLTTLSTGQLQGLIQKNIADFFTQNVSFFNASFFYSKFVSTIDNSDASIQGNDTTITMEKIITPTPGVLTMYVFQFFNAITPGTVQTVPFISTANQATQLRDDGKGNINVWIAGVLFRNNVGTVDYSTGEIDLTQFTFAVPTNTQVTMQANPANENLATTRNNLIVLQQAQVVLNQVS